MNDDRRRTTGPLDDEAVSMGARIRSLRTERGLTLVQLAVAAGMSQPFLSLVERGHARLSLASMAKLSAALGIRSGALLAEPAASRSTADGVDVVHRADARVPSGARSVWQLAQLPGGLFGIEMWGSEEVFSETAVHDEDEFLYLLEGSLEVGFEVGTPDGAVHRLGAGDSLTVAAGIPHGWRAVGPEGYRVVVVTSGGRSH
ncbi:helix-turn-helix domain-containing protein [Herbiconiux solani]|uniref:helix-turn-helix domain-containing protein n=1 Tax=Herbiconiux solani TaxID=661329 RepID=UPI0008253C89|nr:XRE family transcriptional regulator [Herbiconiux solani]